MGANRDVELLSQVYIKILELRDVLAKGGHRLVLAESCTAGMLAALLGQIPGISEHLCGSFIVYRTQTKADWLAIDPELLASSQHGPVSATVTSRLAVAALERTPEATVAAAVTGFLGPQSAPDSDGLVFCSFVMRTNQNASRTIALRLTSPSPTDEMDLAGRRTRQLQAAEFTIEFVLDCLQQLAVS